jgi:adenylate cyclase
MEAGWKSAWLAAAIAVVATLATAFAARSTSISDLDAWTYDFTVNHAGMSGTANNIVLVDFDEETFAHVQQFPIPRQFVADVVSKVGAQKPRVIGLDMFLSETRDPEEDKEMRDALTAAQVVIVASQTAQGSLPPVTPLPYFCHPENENAASGFCVEGTPGAQGYAAINLAIDPDGYVRQANMFAANTVEQPSFALMLAQQYTGHAVEPGGNKRYVRFNGHDVYFASVYETFLIGAWSPEPVQRISAWKVLSEEPDPKTFTDKLVLIGQSSDAARDRHFTPLFRRADKNGTRLRMAGTEVQGAAIRSLIEGMAVRPARSRVIWTEVFVSCFAVGFLLLYFELGADLLAVLGGMIFVCLLSLWLFAEWRFWLPFLPAQLGMALTVPTTLAVRYVQERLLAREAHALRQQLMTLFSRYVDPEVARTIWSRRDEVSLGGVERPATVVFTDIRSFTALSAGQPPADVLGWLNQYLTAMDEVIREHGGFLNKFIGDGLMILFCVPLSNGIHEDARRAVRCSMAMLERVKKLNEENAGNPKLPCLRIGIGIHTGTLMAGTIGSAARQEYSVIGETVNLASRLESLNKQYKTELIMSFATYEIVQKDFTGFVPLGEAKVAGFEQPVPIYTIHHTQAIGAREKRQEQVV